MLPSGSGAGGAGSRLQSTGSEIDLLAALQVTLRLVETGAVSCVAVVCLHHPPHMTLSSAV